MQHRSRRASGGSSADDRSGAHLDALKSGRFGEFTPRWCWCARAIMSTRRRWTRRSTSSCACRRPRPATTTCRQDRTPGQVRLPPAKGALYEREQPLSRPGAAARGRGALDVHDPGFGLERTPAAILIPGLRGPEVRPGIRPDHLARDLAGAGALQVPRGRAAGSDLSARPSVGFASLAGTCAGRAAARLRPGLFARWRT